MNSVRCMKIWTLESNSEKKLFFSAFGRRGFLISLAAHNWNSFDSHVVLQVTYFLRVSTKSGKSRIAGRNQGSGLGLKNITEKSGNSAKTKEIHVNIRKIFVFVSSINRFPSTLRCLVNVSRLINFSIFFQPRILLGPPFYWL